MEEKGRVIVVIPALNPGKVLIELVEELEQNGFERIIVVNDGSSEENGIFRSLAELEKQVDILRHSINLGKGRALKTAFNYILSKYGYFTGVITADADGQHKIQDIVKCRDRLLAVGDNQEMILGCRQFEQNVPFRNRFGNLCTRYILRYLCGFRISDSQTGLRGIPMSMLPALVTVEGERYEYEMNMLLWLVETGGGGSGDSYRNCL